MVLSGRIQGNETREYTPETSPRNFVQIKGTARKVKLITLWQKNYKLKSRVFGDNYGYN